VHVTPISRRLIGPAVIVASLLLAPGATGLGGPSITPVVRGTAGANGWYRSNVTVNWQVSPSPESSSGCDAVTIAADTAGRSVTCSASWSDGTSITVKKTFRIDRTAPRVGAAPDRRADANGWYNHPVTVAFSGTDATSGIVSCARTGYSGPDNPKAVVSGTCTDRAGNVGSASYPFKYDATPPKLWPVRFRRGSRRVALSWTTSRDAKLSQLTRTPGLKGAPWSTLYRGPRKADRDLHLHIGDSYRYTVTVYDEAANQASKTVTITATGPLLSPVPAAKLKSRPHLAWLPVWRANFYNVQLFHDHKKIMSVWPTHPHLRLAWNWRFRKHRFHLSPGKYIWFVWPGFREGSSLRYGKRIGGSTFVVVAR
jgi:hypothetical protein